MKVRFILTVLFFTLMLASPVMAQRAKVQKDTVIIAQEDTVMMRSYAARFDPRKALMYAAVVPGLGQVYNKKYWKLPLVYGGFYLLGRQVYNLNKINRDFREMLFENIEAGTPDNAIGPGSRSRTTGNIRRIVNRSRRDRDFYIIMCGLMYVAQIVDAHVDAHLKEFDLNPNLKMSVEPSITNDQMLGRQTGVSVLLRF